MHEGDLLGEEGLGAENYIVNRGFSRGWVGDAVHVRCQVLKPARSARGEAKWLNKIAELRAK